MRSSAAPAPIADAQAVLPTLFPWVTRDEVFRIETPRLWLRWARPDDAARLHEIASRPEVAGMTATWPHPLPDGEAARRIAIQRLQNAAGSALVLALTLKGAPDRLIGQIGCNALPAEHFGVGYMLDPVHAGRGLVSEALEGFVAAIFIHTRIGQLAASSRTLNPASRRVLEKVGFVFERTGQLATSARGLIDVDFLGLARSDWKRNLDAVRRATATPAAA
jgi:RimJ/RimL family protein N-acetyltransferase